jgi:hypothetical protein
MKICEVDFEFIYADRERAGWTNMMKPIAAFRNPMTATNTRRGRGSPDSAFVEQRHSTSPPIPP